MKVRGERECTECGTRWSYFETGSVSCPGCGSLRSVGSGDRREHTDAAVTLDLADVRADVNDRPLVDVVGDATDRCRTYVARRGFIAGGDLRPLDETYVAALELRAVHGLLAGYRSLGDDEQLYVLSLLRDADDGTRPPAADVPPSLRAARGIAVARAVTDYRRAITDWAADRSLDSETTTALEALGDHATRLDGLDGDIDPETAGTILSATRSLGDALRGDGGTDEVEIVAQLDSLDYRD
ncbi:hypothetical protein C479_15522 [Halovivax asiaticus JCM 14624]|uniref:TFIIB-type zinc ribbon-containing protein n=1 Tax=Halovivax asiaticus JCM 14624 TaxID=1227490 RepID=M0B8G3_9EURY|nr:hypothetical protein [Halovivax asiaticus]ELZ07206.1 hypothetical protein C479_15522 [Halovivax asiaticus JCM 14624]